jgi:hypothetical protein
MNKQIIGIIAAMLMLGTALSPAPETTEDIVFVIQIQKDASISISDLNTIGNSSLQFEPGINLIGEDVYALPKNVDVADDAHWTITNIGNTPAYIYLQLNSTLPAGIQSEIGTAKGYTMEEYVNITNDLQNWLYDTNNTDGAPLSKTQTVNFWQRIAADVTAVGGTNTSLKVLITSFPNEQN